MNGLARFALSDDLGAAWLSRLPAGSIDALVVDPAATPIVRSLRAGSAARGQDDLGALAWEVGRVLAPGRRALWLCESRHGLGLARLLERYGLEVASPAIWDRGEGARGGRLRWILAVSKGRVRGASPIVELPDLIVAPVTRSSSTGLPDPIAEALVMAGSAAGQWILEPFAREPTLALAAVRLERSYWGATHVEEARASLARALHLSGATRLEAGPIALRPRGLDVGLGPSGASQLSFGPVDGERASDLDVPIPSDAESGPRESPDVRGPAEPSDGVRTGAV